MDDFSQIYKTLRCPKCERRLNKPFELKCNHVICQECLESKRNSI